MNLSQALSIKVFVPLMIVVLWMASCLDKNSIQPPLTPVLKPGVQMDGIVLTTGSADVVPRLAQLETDTYAWIANLIIEAPYASR